MDSVSGETGEAGEASGVVKAGREAFALPVGRLARAVVGSAIVVGGLAAGFAAVLRPEGIVGALLGMAATGVGTWIGVVSVQPGVVREGRKWGLAMLRANGVGLVATLVVGGLLYSATRPDPVLMGLTVPLVFIANWVCVAKVLEGVLREKGLAG